MPKKRYHKKSRNGCDRCKSRRVKCDEAHPTCTSCSSRNETCCYTISQQSPRTTSSPRQQESDSPAASSPHIVGSVTSPENRLHELFLLHHWCTKTYRISQPEHTELFREHVVSEALQHTYLLDVIFALASLHIASETRDLSVAYKHVASALEYQNGSVLGLSEALKTSSEYSSDALLVASILNLICALISPLFPTPLHSCKTSTVGATLHAIEHFSGIGVFIQQHMECVRHKALAVLFQKPAILQPDSLAVYSIGDVQRTCASLQPTADLRDTERHTLKLALDHLELAFKETNGRSVFAWISSAGVDFLNLVQRGKSVAEATFMYWGVLLYNLDGTWWAKYAGRTIVEDMSAALGRSNEWADFTKWCLQQVQVDCTTV